MSSDWYLNDPCFSGLHPKKMMHEAVTDALSDEMTEILAEGPLQVSHISPNNENSNWTNGGRYHVRTGCGAKYFIKTVKSSQTEAALFAKKLSVHLNSKKRVTPKFLGAIQNKRFTFYKYEFIDHSFIDPSNLKLAKKLIELIQFLKKEIKNFNQSKEIREAGTSLQTFIRLYSENILSGRREYPGNLNTLRTLFEIYYDPLLPKKHYDVCHGDLNYGNIIVEKYSEEILAVDFEDTRYAYCPTHTDFVLLLERIILLGSKESFKFGAQLVNEYNGHKQNLNAKETMQTLAWLNLRGIVLILNNVDKNGTFNQSEFQKFERLSELAISGQHPVLELFEANDGPA